MSVARGGVAVRRVVPRDFGRVGLGGKLFDLALANLPQDRPRAARRLGVAGGRNVAQRFFGGRAGRFQSVRRALALARVGIAELARGFVQAFGRSGATCESE